MSERDCEHGHLRRSCEICERDKRISELESKLSTAAVTAARSVLRFNYNDSDEPERSEHVEKIINRWLIALADERAPIHKISCDELARDRLARDRLAQLRESVSDEKCMRAIVDAGELRTLVSAAEELADALRIAEQYREAAEKAAAAIEQARIDGAREWCEFLIAEDAYIGHGGMGIENAKTAFARWLASKEGK